MEEVGRLAEAEGAGPGHSAGEWECRWDMARMEAQDRAASLFCLTLCSKVEYRNHRDKVLIRKLMHDLWARAVTQPVSVWRAGALQTQMRRKTIREMDKGGLAHLIQMAEEKQRIAESNLRAAEMKAAEAEAKANSIVQLLKKERENRKREEAKMRHDLEELRVLQFQAPVDKFVAKWQFGISMRLILKWRFNIEVEKQDNTALLKLKATIRATREELKSLANGEDELRYVIQCKYLEDKIDDARLDRKRAFVLLTHCVYNLLGEINLHNMAHSFHVWKIIILQRHHKRRAGELAREVDSAFAILSEEKLEAMALVSRNESRVAELSHELGAKASHEEILEHNLHRSVKNSSKEVLVLQEQAKKATSNAKAAERHALKARVRVAEAERGNQIALDVVELQREALESEKEEAERSRLAYQHALRVLEEQDASLLEKESLRSTLISAHESLVDALSLLRGREPNKPHSEAKEELREALFSVADAELASQNEAMMDKVVRGIRIKLAAAEGALEPPLHVDHHADHHAAPIREVPAPALRRVDMRRPSTSSLDGGLSSLGLALGGAGVATGEQPHAAAAAAGTALSLGLVPPRGMTPPALMAPSSKLFMTPQEMQERAATSQGDRAGWGKARGIMAVGRMVPKQALRSVDDWVNAATKKKPAGTKPPPPAVGKLEGKLDKRPLPPITPELEPPITP